MIILPYSVELSYRCFLFALFSSKIALMSWLSELKGQFTSCSDSEGILTVREKDFSALAALCDFVAFFNQIAARSVDMRAFCVLIYDLAAPIKVGERSVAIKVWQQRQQRDGDGEMNSYVKEPRGGNRGDLCSVGRHGTHRHGNRPCAIAPSSSSSSCFTSPPPPTVIGEEMTGSFLVAKPLGIQEKTSLLPLIGIPSSFHWFTAATSLLLSDHSLLIVVPICFVSTKKNKINVWSYLMGLFYLWFIYCFISAIL